MKAIQISKHKSNPLAIESNIEPETVASPLIKDLSLHFQSYSQALKVPMQQKLITLDMLSKGNDSDLHRTGSFDNNPQST
jgi:hypothetical protein